MNITKWKKSIWKGESSDFLNEQFTEEGLQLVNEHVKVVFNAK